MILRWAQFEINLKVAYEGPFVQLQSLKKALHKIEVAHVKWKLNNNMQIAKANISKFKWFTLSSQTLTILRTFQAIKLLDIRNKYIWTIEKDVAFLGNPKVFFDSYITSNADLISSSFSHVNHNYWGFLPRTFLANATYKPDKWPWNVSKIQDDIVIWRAIMVERFSQKLLAFVENLTDYGLFMQAEIFESTVCYNEDWCKIEKWDEHTNWKSAYFVPNTGKLRHRFPNCLLASKCCRNQFLHPMPELKHNLNCNTTLRA